MRTGPAKVPVYRFGEITPEAGLRLEQRLRTRKPQAGRGQDAFERGTTIRLLAVPDVLQTRDYTCGPDSLRAVLGYFGRPMPKTSELARMMHTNPQTGTEPADIARVAVALGLSAQLRQKMSLADLAQYARHDIAVIVNYQAWRGASSLPWSRNWGDGHYAVVVGVDEHNVYLEDPWVLGRRDVIPRQEFVDRWHGGENRDGRRFLQGGIIISDPARAVRR